MKSIFKVVAITMIMLFVSIVDVHAAEIVDLGTCGEDLTWTLDDEGFLYISGTGEMEDYSEGGAPWYQYDLDIKSVEVTGATSIGRYACYGCIELVEVKIGDSVEVIRMCGFYECVNLEKVILPV